eukprot:Em0302g2a
MELEVPLRLIFFLAAVRVTTQDSCVSLQASAKCSVASYPACRSLQDILLNLSSGQWPGMCVTLNLLDGVHSLTAPVLVNATAYSLTIIGSNSSLVSCAFNSSNATNLHSIHLYGLNTVVISSVSAYGCDRPFRLQNVGYLRIVNSALKSFVGGGALDVYNCLTTEIVDCSFEDNYATSVIQDSQYRGNAGGVAIGIHGVVRGTNQTKPSVLVAGSSFARNIAQPDNQVTSSTLIQRRVFVGRGGGLAVYVEEDAPVIITINGCTFRNNSATTRGGGVFLFLDGTRSGHMFLLANSVLEGNSVTASNGGGGGVVVTLFIPLDKRFPNNVLISNCTLLRNQAHYGGGAYVLPALSPGDGYYVSFENSLFDGNYASEYAAAIGFASLAFFQSFTALHPYRITSCVFQNNMATTGGIIGVPYIPVVMDGHNVFTNNTGATLRVIGATLTLNGTFEFIGNNADTSDGEGTAISFHGNHGRLGAAFVTEYSPEVPGFTKLLYNPLCFIRYEDNQLSPFLWKGLNVSFSGNSALIGPVAYISQLDFCSWRGLTEPFFDSQNIIKWPFVTADGSNRNLGHPSESIGDRTFYVQTPAASLHIESTSFSVFAGETVPLKLESLDEIGHPTYAIFRLANSVSLPTGESGPIFNPTLLSELPSLIANSFSFSLASKEDNISSINVSLSLFGPQDHVLSIEGIADNTISIATQPCPPGYELEDDSYNSTAIGLTCVCDTLHDGTIVNCEPSLDSVLLQPSLWAVSPIYNTSAGPNTHGSVYTYNSPEAQCNCNRSGVLCGSCPQGCGVSVLTNRCVTCGNENGLLILALCVVVVMATIIIMIYPHPLMAGFYPCLFAIQLAPLISEEFPISFESIHPYLYYISSFLALYFPYDFCLLNNLNPLASYFLRYTPPLLVTLTVVITLVIRKKVLRLRSIPCLYYGGQRVILDKMCLHLDHIFRWYVDGTVECFTQGHLPLALFAILALVLEAGLIPLVVMISMEKLKQPLWLRHLVQPLTDAFKEDWRWWGAMELARRFLLLLFTLPFPGNPIPPSYLLMAYLCAYAFIQPYKSAVVNLVEVALCVDLLVMLLIVGDSAITEDLLYSHTTQLSVSQSNQDGCVVSGFTRFTGLLTPFYYLPLLAGVVCIAVGVALLLRSLKGKFKDVDLSQRGGTEDASQRERINSDPFFISNSLQTNSRTTISLEDVDNRGRRSAVEFDASTLICS